MLSLKSREQTPDDVKPSSGYQEVQFQRPEDSTVPLMGVEGFEGVKEVAPPPKEPPTGGTGCFRITTKKKAYAQIPGLSSGDTSQKTFSLSSNQANPSYFIPPPTNQNITGVGTQKIPLIKEQQSPNTNIHIDQTKPNVNYGQTEVKNDSYNIFNPIVSDNINQGSASENQPNSFMASTDNAVDFSAAFEQKSEKIVISQSSSQLNYNQQLQDYNAPPIGTAAPQGSAIIPPPPMFSNLTKKDSQTSLAKSILPPSVARRISANQPIIKTTQVQSVTTSVAAFTNIFVPTSLPENPQNVSSITATDGRTLAPSNLQITTLAQSNALSITPNDIRATSVFAQINLPTGNIQSPIFTPLIASNSTVPAVSSSDLTQLDVLSRSPTNIPIATVPRTNSSLTITSQTATSHVNVPSLSTSAPTCIQPPLHVPSQMAAISGQTPSLFASRNTAELHTSAPINVPPPPTFFNPNTYQPVQQHTTESKDINTPYQNNRYFDSNTAITEPPKSLAEPPKAPGNINFRMTKKRPQYYSGPIEGVGAISNNVKPIIPPVETNTFKGALLNPEQQIRTPVPEKNILTPNLEHSTVPFNINKPVENVSTYAFDSKPQEQSYIQPEYSTAFDLSRQTTEYFEPPKEESRGFGIIGSLKSKLSSLDINKIQNTVTTFFDPTYSDSKKDQERVHENMPYGHYQNPPSSYGPYTQNQNSNFEIFVPNVEQTTQPCNQSCDTVAYQSPAYNYEQNQYSQSQDQYNYCQNQDRNVYPSTSYYSDVTYGTSTQQCYINSSINANVYESHLATSKNISHGNDPENTDLTLNDPQNITALNAENVQTSHALNPRSFFEDKNFVDKHDINPLDVSATTALTHELINEENSTAKTFFDKQQTINATPLLQCGPLEQKLTNLQSPKDSSINNEESYYCASDNKHDVQDIFTTTDNAVTFFSPSVITQTESVNEGNLFANLNIDTNVSSSHNVENKDNKESFLESDAPTLNISSIDITSPLIADLENNMKNVTLDEISKSNFTVFNQEKSVMSDSKTETKPTVDVNEENASDLNICETCREVNVTDEKPDGLTAQLIENITSPIQLSNPVEVPLTETSTTIDDRSDFDSNQCAEISHITEETIETIQSQSVTDLLEDDETNTENVRNYGWYTDDTTSFPQSHALLEHDYSFQPDADSIGFFGKNSLFFDNIPNNASDEIKAEFKNTHEDSPIILPRQMSIPSAPPADEFDDTKSDETGGLDVLSIEQDAKKDFPIYEEFVIEPSETDDDKIEFKERERSSEDPVPELDTFTNRVERFKKMEESTTDASDEVFEQKHSQQLFDIPTTSNPAISIASYFDTGNYAVETHYRNSLTSPNISMRIPPGFEEEFKRKHSINENIPFIPDTTTQTRTSPTLTYTNVMNAKAEELAISSDIETKLSDLIQDIKPTLVESEKLPDFATVFGNKAGYDKSKSIFASSEATVSEEIPQQTQVHIAQTLPDPVNFFSSHAEPSTAQDPNVDSGINRLASYFASPTKTDHTKSFFELSQSQDHYRQRIEPNQNVLRAFESNQSEKSFFGDDKVREVKDHKTFFELSQSQDHYIDGNTQNIPADKYIANLNLMRDLTSYQNLDFSPKEEVVRTVNYFTVEYDNDKLNLKSDFNKGEPEHIVKSADVPIENIKCDSTHKPNLGIDELVETDHNNVKKLVSIINHCKYCCNPNTGFINNTGKVNTNIIIGANFKVKTAMDSDHSENRKEGEANMDHNNDGTSRRPITNVDNYLHEESSEDLAMMSENRSSTEYTPVKHHWFYRVDCEGKSIWRGFSLADSRALEDGFHSLELNENTLVPTDGGRYDVNIVGRLRFAVYWTEKPTNVRRCSWFYKGNIDARYIPYTEAIAEKLEEEYRHGVTTGEWHRRLNLPNNEMVVMHGPAVMVHLFQTPTADAFSSPAQSAARPRVVRRGCDESEIEDTEPSNIDHLLLLCHGVGSACDMRFRSVEEVVNDFRATSLQLTQSHYRNSCDNGIVGRVEVLPIAWHSSLHSGANGVDRRLARITLDSIPRLRGFTNDTVLDVLFYTSPVFCQTIIDTVCSELNRIYNLFKSRNPDFKGGISLGGHSLGSVILYDLLCHQEPRLPDESATSPGKKYVTGTAGTGQPTVKFPRLEFAPEALYALGSPIAIFECIRGVETLGLQFQLPTCKYFFNIFHPYDPIAYRIEPLINTELQKVKPYLIPHHKGRKRMHLELKETMARVGADIKQKVLESIRTTWTSMWRTQPPPNDQLEKVVEEEIDKEQLAEDSKDDTVPTIDLTTPQMLGALNKGRRVDYVLQEAPFEMINEYLSSMTSHVCYWESEDTMLLILREIYAGAGVRPDGSLPQRSLTVERTRTLHDETIVTSSSEHPSTSRGGT